MVDIDMYYIVESFDSCVNPLYMMGLIHYADPKDLYRLETRVKVV